MPSQQRDLARDVIENIPVMTFVAVWQSGAGIEVAGWIGSVLAAIVLGGFYWRRVPTDPIIFGANVHLLLATPLIIGAFSIGLVEIGRLMAAYVQPAVFLTVFAAGLLRVVGGRSLLRAEGNWSEDRLASISLLAAIIGAGGWAFTYNGPPLLQFAFPFMAIFLARRFIIAHRADRNGAVKVLVVGTAPQLAADMDA